MSGRYASRRVRNRTFLGLSVLATGFGLGFLGLILGTLLYEGFSGLDVALFTESTPPPGLMGGLLNAIVGSLFMTTLAVLVGTPLGIFAGTYLAEYGRYTRLAFVVRLVNDILLSAPSIVLGLFIYEVMVVNMGHFSAWAGAAALAVIVIPVVVRTTEGMLLLVPNTLREAAAALGAPRWHVIAQVTWLAARAGIVTGALLAIARISGETAPLLFTALNNQFWNLDPNQPMASLPVAIFQMAMSPYEDWHRLAWSGALLVTMAVLVLSIIARVLEARQEAHWLFKLGYEPIAPSRFAGCWSIIRCKRIEFLPHLPQHPVDNRAVLPEVKTCRAESENLQLPARRPNVLAGKARGVHLYQHLLCLP